MILIYCYCLIYRSRPDTIKIDLSEKKNNHNPHVHNPNKNSPEWNADDQHAADTLGVEADLGTLALYLGK